MTLRESIEKHIDGRGTGFELDDVVSGGGYPKELEDRIYQISVRFRTPEYPIGTDNPASFKELRKLIDDYE